MGVLSATTAFGKTVIGAYLIEERKVNTLVLVHSSALLEQWRASLEQFLTIHEVLPELPKKRGRKKKRCLIGQVGAGKDTRGGIIDIAIMQSLFEGEEKEVKSFVCRFHGAEHWRSTPDGFIEIMRASTRFVSTTMWTFIFPCWSGCTTSGWRATRSWGIR